jgi:hypothetical protein
VRARRDAAQPLVRRTGTASRTAAWHNLPGTEVEATVRVAAERGVVFARDFMVSNVSTYLRNGIAVPVPAPGPLAEVAAARPQTSVHWAEAEQQSELLLFHIMQAPADVDLSDLGTIAGVEPIARGPERSYVDSCCWWPTAGCPCSIPRLTTAGG